MSATHTLRARSLHWAFVVLYGYGVFKQLDDVSQLEDGELLRFEVGFASLFLAVLGVRFAYMRRFQALKGARVLVSAERRRWARSLHGALYLCLAMLPLSGLSIAGLYSAGIEEGLRMDLVVGLHELCADLSYLLIGLHVAAAVLSRLEGEGIWSAMVPLWRERAPTDET